MTTDTNALGPAERIIQALLSYSDHMVHNRPGIVVPDTSRNCSLRWKPVSHRLEDGVPVVYELRRSGRRTIRVRLGVLAADGSVLEGERPVGEYRAPGLFPEVAAWMYKQVAEVWKLDNEFAARWASYAFAEEHRDLKVVLAAFMLVQSRKGEPVVEDGKTLFCDEDYRNVGEAMILLRRKDKKDLNPKLLLRVREVLTTPAVAEINRELGFGRSSRSAFLGRWPKAVTKWLHFRETNPRMLAGLVNAGFRTSVMELARRVGYKPQSPAFFEALRWKQTQSSDGRRTMAIGASVAKAESWAGLTELQICEAITSQRIGWKRIVGLLPSDVGLTRAIAAASIEAGALSDKDLVILTPTLEGLGLLEVQDVRERWERAVKAAEDLRAANVAKAVQSESVQKALVAAADGAMKKATQEAARNLEVYVFVDISASMQESIEAAKTYVSKFLQGFALERLHVATFNTQGRVVEIKHASQAGVQNAFRGIRAGGGTSHAAGIRALRNEKPGDDADVLFFFVGDEEESGTFTQAVRDSGLAPMAFGFVKTVSPHALPERHRRYVYSAVRDTAVELGIPCFLVEEDTFEDPYAIPRTIRNLVASTPVGQKISGRNTPTRVSLVDQILQTKILVKPAWA